jgi:hypothetical protein
MEYLDASGTWKPVEANTNLFAPNALWEPGHTEVVYLKVVNEGSLSFNYKLGVNIVEEVKSINVNGEEFKLSDYIMMGAVKDKDTAFATREDARGALDMNEVNAIADGGYAQAGVLFAKGDTNIPTDGKTEEYLALVVYMPETVGNDANYRKGADVPTITLGVNILATQYTHEKDSYDEKYDAGANVSLPPIPVEEVTVDVTVYDVFTAGYPTADKEDVTLDIYTFIADDFSSMYPVEDYKNWTCDYFVSTDAPIDDGIALIGSYGTFGWLGFWAPASTTAYEPTGLLGAVTSTGESNWTYENICNDVQIFYCGIKDFGGNNSGVKATVDLRMTSPDKTQTIVVASITVTL